MTNRTRRPSPAAWVAALALLIGGAPAARADETLEELLARWKNPLDQLGSASYEMSIAHKRPDNALANIKVKYSFDQALGGVKASIKHVGQPFGGDWLRNRQYVAQAAAGNPIVAIQPPSTPLLRWAAQWDVQYLGLALYGDLVNDFKRESLEENYNRLRKEKKYTIKPVGKLTMAEVLVADGATDRIRIQITFDPEKAYAIVSEDYYLKPRNSDAYSHASSSQLEYEPFGPLWLPVKGRFRGHANETADVAIKWSSVNQPLTAHDFDVRSMDLPDSHVVEDLMQGYQKDKNMRTLGDLRNESHLQPTDPVQVGPKPRDWTLTAVLGGVLAALLAVVAVVARRAARKPPETATSAD